MTMFRCPKCSHEQENQVECEACGLIFSKFEQAQERRRRQADTVGEARPKAAGRSLASVAVLLVVVGVAAYFFASDRKKKDTGSAAHPVVTGAYDGASGEATGGVSTRQVVPPTEIEGTPIEQARNGTVAIETPWGQGSGFFITDTTIVTNKHVIAPDNSQISEFRHKVETGRRLIDLEKEKNEELRRQVNRMGDGPSRSQLIIVLQERERNLAKIIPTQEEAESQLRSMERTAVPSDIKVFLVDGSALSAQSIQTSSSRDLALVSVSARGTALRPAPKNSYLRQGDRVYTIGSPVGLRNTVTSGVFSCYRQSDETKDVLLQTDAPINPGNSGGPLIDERGLVHGVNTMIIRGTQGIGFAIPIQAVLEEFSIR